MLLLRKLVTRTLLQTAVFAALLFGPAGTLSWWQAWVLLGLMAAGTVATLAALYPHHRDILEERLKPPLQKGQPLADKALVLVLLATLSAALVFIPVDIFRLHGVMGRPSFTVSALGLGLLGIGWWIIYRTLVENAFAALAVRHQTERRHRVIDSGVYAVVRHPMYAGASLFCLGLPLWLGSFAATLAALAPVFVLAVRCVIEERFLRRELSGYEDYMWRVRWRLVPGLW